MSQQHQLPSGQFVPTSASDVRAGDTILWYSEPCTVESVTSDEAGHVHLAFSRHVRYETELAHDCLIHVRRTEKNSTAGEHDE